MEHRRLSGAADRSGPLRRRRRAAPGSTACTASRWARARRRAAPCISRSPACTARTPPASPSARPAPPTSAPRTASCWSTRTLCIGCGLCAWACPYGARELDLDEGVMKKCTLCIDRIYNEQSRRGSTASRPACAPARPARAISATSPIRTRAVSRLVAERGGFDLMPELGTRPTNKYLPPRPRQAAPGCTGAPAALEPAEPRGRLSRLAGSRARRLMHRIVPRHAGAFESRRHIARDLDSVGVLLGLPEVVIQLHTKPHPSGLPPNAFDRANCHLG